MNNPHGSYQIHVIGSEGQLFGTEHTLWKLPNGEKEPQKFDLPPVQTIPAGVADFVRRVRSRERPLHGIEEGRLVLEVITRATQDAGGWRKPAR